MAPARAQGTIEFDKEIWPILQDPSASPAPAPRTSSTTCGSTPRAAILKGGKNGKVLTAGDPDKSSLYVRVALPPDDLDIMPAEGDPLTAAQIDTLKRWIAGGADFGSWTAPYSGPQPAGWAAAPRFPGKRAVSEHLRART